MPCTSFSMLDGAEGTGCNEVSFPVHGCLGSRDVGVVGVFDCVKSVNVDFLNQILYLSIE